MGPQRFTVQEEGFSLVGEVYFPRPGGRHPVVVVCHGVPAGPPDPADPGYPALARRLSGEGFIAVIFNFRGTGASGGNFDMMGWARDLGRVLDYVSGLPQAEPRRAVLMGFSGGAAVAVYVAAHDPRVAAAVLLACPAYFDEGGAGRMLEHARSVGIIRDPDFPRSPEEWWRGFMEVSPIRWIGRIAPRPVVLIHGEEDELIPVAQARQLYLNAGEPRELHILEGAGHRLRRDERAVALALTSLKRLLT